MSLHQRLLNSPQELTEFLETQGFHDLPDEEVITLGKSNLLIHAAYLGQFQVVNTLLSHADLRAVAENGGNVVDWLCFRSDTTADCLASVLQKWTKKFGESDMKSMLNSTRMKQGTPLMCAVFAPNVAVTQLLLRWESSSSLRQSIPYDFRSRWVHTPNICWSAPCLLDNHPHVLR
jgi:hypothetical protein